MTDGEGYPGSYWRGSSQRPSDELLQLERNTAPSMRRTQRSERKVQLQKRCFRRGPRSAVLSTHHGVFLAATGTKAPSRILSTSNPTWTSLGSNPSISVRVSTILYHILAQMHGEVVVNNFLVICHVQSNDKITSEL
jgi:hypothetical protein